MNESPGFIHNVSSNVRYPVHFIPSVCKVLQEDGHVVIRIGTRIATGARSEEYDTLDAVTVNSIQRGAKTDQNGIDDCHGANVA